MTTIMIIDDSEPDQFLSKIAIQKHDPSIEILQAYDGQEGLDILSDLDQQPDVIFLDINMPRMNGHEFLEQYSTWDVQGAVIVMLTSSDQDCDKERSLAYNCVKRYLTKPLDKDTVSLVVKSIQ